MLGCPEITYHKSPSSNFIFILVSAKMTVFPVLPAHSVLPKRRSPDKTHRLIEHIASIISN